MIKLSNTRWYFTLLSNTHRSETCSNQLATFPSSFLNCNMLHYESSDAPCQCSSLGGIQTVSPTVINLGGPFLLPTRPMPSKT